MRDIGTGKRFILLCLMLLAAVSGGCGKDTQTYFTAESEREPAVASEEDTQKDMKEAASDSGILFIYVCGEVASPGVYELPAGSRICDAAEAAGGMTEAASGEYWNLAEPLCDGQMIYFPTEEEAKSRQMAAGASAPASSGITADGRVNINTATLEELMTIPGVGQTRGEAILAYRQEHDGFKSPQEIMKVSGIGSTLYERMSGCIAVE